MLVLFETPAGYALFKVLDKAKLARAEDVCKHFDTPQHAAQVRHRKRADTPQDERDDGNGPV